MPSDLTFYSAWYCPFAQRTWAALEHLELPYAYEETDPYHKSTRWMHISRGTGQVPVLTTKKPDMSEMRIPGSLRTIEYLADFSGNSDKLFPEGASARAEARFWLDHQGAKIIPNLYRFLKAQTASEAAGVAKSEMLTGLLDITQAMSNAGPYFFGATPGIVDFALAPFTLRIELLLSHYKGFQLPRAGADWHRYWKWSDAIQAHPAFIATMPEQETFQARLLEFYIPYSQGGGQADVTNPT